MMKALMIKMVLANSLLKLCAQMRVVALIFAVALMTHVTHGCATNPVTGESDLVLMSEEEEIELGRQLSKTLPKQFGGAYESGELTRYVAEVGERLVPHIHRTNLIYHFVVLDSPIINAFALPGGYVYISRGMLANFNSEGELAAVLAHELAHITARHGVTRHTKATLIELLGDIAIRSAGAAGTQWETARQILSQAIISGYSRSDEHQADTVGVEYLAKAGYSPEYMLDVLEILKAQERYQNDKKGRSGKKDFLYHIFSTHPDNEARTEEVIRKAKKLGAKNPSDEDRLAYLKRIDNLEYGESSANGIVRNNTLYNEKLDIAITFPALWKIKKHKTHIDAHAEDDSAKMRLVVRDHNRNESETDHLKRYLGAKNLSDIAPLGTSSGGYTAVVKKSAGKEFRRVAAIYKGKRVYQFDARAKERHAQNDALFLRTMKSFRKLLSEEDKRNAQPQRIQLIRTKPDDTISAIVHRLKLDDKATDDIRLINGLYPRGEPLPNTLIKIIR